MNGNRQKILLRTIQGLTILSFTAIAILLFLYFQSQKRNPKELQSSVLSANQMSSPQAIRRKVKRPKIFQDPTFRGLIEEGDRARFRGDFELAAEAYDKAGTLQPNQSESYEKRGDLAILERDYEKALSAYRRARVHAPQNIGLGIKTVRSFIGLRKIIDAKTELFALHPDTQVTLFYKGLLAAFLNDSATAKDFFEQTRANGENETIKKQAEKFLQAYAEFEVARNAEHSHLQAMLAKLLDEAGEYGLAIELSYAALKKNFDYRDVWMVLGHSLLNEHKWSDAETALTKAVDLDAGLAAGFFFRGLGRKHLKKNAEALKDFESALKKGYEPRTAAQRELADAYFELKQFSLAFPLYREITLADPTDLNLFIRPMALAINHLGRPEEAIPLAQKAYESHPDTGLGHNLLGWAAIFNGDLDAAQSHIKEAIARDPKLPAAYLNLGQLEERRGNREAALAAYEKAIALAEEKEDRSIGNTAVLRYNALKSSTATLSVGPSYTPPPPPPPTEFLRQEKSSPSKKIPSLSLSPD